MENFAGCVEEVIYYKWKRKKKNVVFYHPPKKGNLFGVSGGFLIIL